jgi:hypothetical protein
VVPGDPAMVSSGSFDLPGDAFTCSRGTGFNLEPSAKPRLLLYSGAVTLTVAVGAIGYTERFTGEGPGAVSGHILVPPSDTPSFFSVNVANLNSCGGPWQTFVLHYSIVELTAVPPPPREDDIAASVARTLERPAARSWTTTPEGTFELP